MEEKSKKKGLVYDRSRYSNLGYLLARPVFGFAAWTFVVVLLVGAAFVVWHQIALTAQKASGLDLMLNLNVYIWVGIAILAIGWLSVYDRAMRLLVWFGLPWALRKAYGEVPNKPVMLPINQSVCFALISLAAGTHIWWKYAYLRYPNEDVFQLWLGSVLFVLGWLLYFYQFPLFRRTTMLAILAALTTGIAVRVVGGYFLEGLDLQVRFPIIEEFLRSLWQ